MEAWMMDGGAEWCMDGDMSVRMHTRMMDDGMVIRVAERNFHFFTCACY